MLSLPLITPHEDLNIWNTNPSHRPTQTLESPENQQPQVAQQQSRRQQSNSRSSLALLIADENVIEQRKQNVRRFGAGWIRPPGIAKTYQATMDELAEREEQEALARREQQMLDLANAAEMEARRAEAEIAAEEANEVDRDLDEDIPEAEEEADLDDDIPEADDEDDSDDGEAGDMTFNEESFIEGSMVQADVEQMLEIEEGAAMIHDLDDDIPEAGSYQHTDTELEDDTSELGGLGEGSSRIAGNPGAGFRQSFRSEPGSSLFGGSSFLGSSPAAGRGGMGSLFSRSQQQQARQSRQH